MSQTNPGPGSSRPVGRQRSATVESSAPGITDVATPNPFISTAQALSPFNRARFARIQNNKTRDRRRTNAGFSTVRLSDANITAVRSTPIPEEPHVSPSMASLRRMYQPPDTAPRTRAPSVASESEGHSSIADGEESVHEDLQDPDVPDLPPD
ncbi:hypothetical protein GGU11DRAFT_760702 [Lentinula aff. detonsa]|nr:hypothetical protein GGU11DRAFT_760702 [Lentinula aff. detonsa]